MAPDGTATFVWVLLAAGASSTRPCGPGGSRPDGTLGPVRELDADTYEAWGPAVAAGPDGSAVAAWHRLDADGAGELVISRRIAPDGRIGRSGGSGPGCSPTRHRGWRSARAGARPSCGRRSPRTCARAASTPAFRSGRCWRSRRAPRACSGRTWRWARAARRPSSGDARPAAATRSRRGGSVPSGSLGRLRTLARNGPDTAWPDVAMTSEGRRGRRLAGGRARRLRPPAPSRRFARRVSQAPRARTGRPAARRALRLRRADRRVDEPASRHDVGRAVRGRGRGRAKRRPAHRRLTSVQATAARRRVR